MNSFVNLHCLEFVSYLKSQHSVQFQSLPINRISLNITCLRQRLRKVQQSVADCQVLKSASRVIAGPVLIERWATNYQL